MALLHDLIPLASQASLFLLALAIGLDCGIDDALYVLRRPRLALRLLLHALPAIRRSRRKAHAYGLLVAAGVLALVALPLAAALVGAMPGRHGGPAPLAWAGEVIVLVFVPLAAGMAMRVLAPVAATRAVPAIGGCAGLALLLAGVAAVRGA